MAERSSVPLLAPPPPQRPARRACLGHVVLITSVILLVASCLLAFVGGGISYVDFIDDFPGSKSDTRTAISSFVVAYMSAATLLLSVIIYQAYFFCMRGTIVRDLAASGLRRRFTIILSCYWFCFVGGETSLIIAIKGLYDRESRWVLFGFTVFLDVFTALFMIGLDMIVDDIQLIMLLHDPMIARINALTARIKAMPEFIVESAKYDNCVICIEPPAVGDRVRDLGCQHIFHKACIDRWLLRSSRCPHCRRGVNF